MVEGTQGPSTQGSSREGYQVQGVMSSGGEEVGFMLLSSLRQTIKSRHLRIQNARSDRYFKLSRGSEDLITTGIKLFILYKMFQRILFQPLLNPLCYTVGF